MRNLLTLLLLTVFSVHSIAQDGTLRGTITDMRGEELIGATVILKNNPSLATICDFQGNYTIKIPAGTPQIINVSFVGHQTIEDTVIVQAGKVTIENYVMNAATEEIEGVVVYGKANKEKDIYMRQVKMKSATSIDYISKETIKKTGDSYVDDAIKRVTGVSTVQGFIAVRGLADRYVKTTFNGARIPTLDPYTNNIRLDMFPTSLVDNIVVTKTQSPHLPGDWTGAYLSIETKDYPQKFTVSAKTSFGFNAQTTFKDNTSSQRSSTDWLGYDDGLRDFDHSRYSRYYDKITAQQFFETNGQPDYIASLGLDPQNPDHLNQNLNEISPDNIYYRLNMVQYGILAPAHINNSSEYNTAHEQIRNQQGDHYQDAFTSINASASEFGQMLPNSWTTTRRQAPFNFSQDLTIGDQVALFGNPLGLLTGFKYSTYTRSDPNAETNDYVYRSEFTRFDTVGKYNRDIGVETNEWSFLAGASYRVGPYHSVSLLFMPNFSGTNKARVDSGYSDGNRDEYAWDYEIIHDQQYEERRQLIYQYQSNHFFPVIGLKIDLRASYTDGLSSIPDMKNLGYGSVFDNSDLVDDYRDSTGATLYAFSKGFDSRLTRYLDEDIFDTRFNAELPIFNKPSRVRKLKFGAAYLSNTRDVELYYYTISTEAGPEMRLANPNDKYPTSSFKIRENQQGVLLMQNSYYQDEDDFFKFSIGESKITAGYMMLDFELTKRFRFAGGLRVEYSEQLTKLKFSRAIPPPAKYNLDYIPSVNLVYNIINNDRISFNMRGSYSKSLGRPSVRELTPYGSLDYELGRFVKGNADLRTTYVDNYDLRFESYFNSGEFVSVSAFHKVFQDNIEMVFDSQFYTWENAGSGEASGLEIEGKKNIIQNLSVAANVTLIKSHTTINIYNQAGIPYGTINRDMYGQSPYIVNGILDYNSEKSGFNAALSYNVQGPKIALASVSQDDPDVYEMPVHRIDFKATKSIGNHFGIELKIRNLLSESITRAYYHNDSYDYIFDSYNFGTDFILSVTYNL